MWISKKYYYFLKEEYANATKERDELRLRVAELEDKLKKHGHWIYWGGWCGNHDMRIDDAVCSECGYKHPTVRWELGDPRGEAGCKVVLKKLKDECPKCGAVMQK